MMTESDVIELLDRLAGVQVVAWLDGGWGVDALLGEQTRPHKDLDLIVRVEDVPRMRAALARDGFRLVTGEPGSNFVLRDRRGREIDVHPARFDDDGNGIYRMENGEDWVFPADGFTGTGRVGRRNVTCLTADVQMVDHTTGYEPGETDFHDMRLLNERLGTRLLPPFDADPAADPVTSPGSGPGSDHPEAPEPPR
jgi:lincosamide nucleotidyltransferase A/C/D/E